MSHSRANQFFRILDVVDDKTYPHRWFLGSLSDAEGSEMDNRLLTYGKRVKVVGGLSITIRQRGIPNEFTFADFELPVLRKALSEAIELVAPDSIQRFPVHVIGGDAEYDLLNVIRCVDCLDEDACVKTRWTIDDGRPDKIGLPRSVGTLALIYERAAGSDIFRIRGWTGPIIVSARMKEAMESSGCSGIRFLSVSVC